MFAGLQASHNLPDTLPGASSRAHLVDYLAQEMPKNRAEKSAHTYHYLGAFLRSRFQRPAQGDALLSTQVAP